MKLHMRTRMAPLDLIRYVGAHLSLILSDMESCISLTTSRRGGDSPSKSSKVFVDDRLNLILLPCSTNCKE